MSELAKSVNKTTADNANVKLFELFFMGFFLLVLMQFGEAALWHEVSTVRGSGWVLAVHCRVARLRTHPLSQVVLTSCHSDALTKLH